MAKVVLFTLCVTLILPRGESCSIPGFLSVDVPPAIPRQYEITKVDVSGCEGSTGEITVTDPSFTVTSHGAILASTAVYVGGSGRTFSVRAWDAAGEESVMVVHLVPWRQRQSPKKSPDFLKRSKRRWGPAPFNILENDKGPYPKDIDTVASDTAANQDVYYTISGHGVEMNPVEVFSLNRDTGMLRVHKPVDREMFPNFTLRTRVFSKATHLETDLFFDIKVIVDDMNDNAPQFNSLLQFTVPEQSKAGTVVGKVDASDKDEPGSLHVKIKYSLKNGVDLFAIDPVTGVITTVTNTLDREVKDKHLVTVEIRDLQGAVTGLFNTATATITVGDINDNPPTFTKASYTASVKENEQDKLILRIPVEDKDQVKTPNWISKFVLTKGNENGNFRIDRDPITNDGLLYVTKLLNHEKTPKVKLEIMARNEAELSGTREPWKSIPVDLTVGDIDEGPEFAAPTIRFTVKENTPNGTLIGSYTAVDPETKSSSGINYYKVSDPALWINMDKNTGELKVANTIDRESHFVQDGIYNITVKAVDATGKSATGTVIILVEDANDNMPTVPVSELIMCEKPGELGSVVVVAEDKDASPFSSPFTFHMPTDSDGQWSVTKLNETAAVLKHNKELPTGMYSVPVEIADLQGFGKTQMVPVRICQCKNGGGCLDKDRSTSLGSMGILAMLLPLALLLLLCLLLGFFCGTQREKVQLEDMGDGGGIILKSNTEGRGDEVDVSLLPVSSFAGQEVTKGSVKGVQSVYPGVNSMSTVGPHSTTDNWMYKSGADLQYASQFDAQYAGNYGGQLVGSGVNFDNGQLLQGSSFLRNWEANGIYLREKLHYLGTEEDGCYAEDSGHAYGFEGVGSAAGSVGCCSDFDDSENLEFLNALGPKFKSLAEVCQKT